MIKPGWDTNESDWFKPLIKNYLGVDKKWYEVYGIDSPYHDVMDWVQLNVKGPCKNYGRCWFFRDANDYTAFILRWKQ